MQWLLAVVLAVLGSAFGGVSATALGLMAGALIGWLLGSWLDASRRLRQIEEQILGMRVDVARQTAPSTRAEAAGFAPQPAPTAAQATTPAPSAAAAPLTPAEEQRARIDALAAARQQGPFADSPLPAASRADARTEPVEEMPAPAIGARVSNAARFDVQPTASTATPGESRLEAAAVSDTPKPTPRVYAQQRYEPQGPDFAERFGATMKRWFTEGNVPVKIGVIVFLFGIGAALKYVADQGWLTFPIEYRLIGIALAALVGLVIGWRERTRRRAFALAIQGGAIGVLLLTVFASFGLYHVLEPAPAFAFIIVLVAGASLLAVLQNAPALAALGFFGGYLAPVIIRTGSNDHVALFSYYAVLNAAVFAIATVKTWRALNLIGFFFTFAVGLAWGAQYYEPRHFATVEPFLVAFFLFYVAIAVLYALRQEGERRGIVDGSITFGTPLLAFPLQAAMLRDDPMGLAFSALAVAALYGGLAWWLIKRRGLTVLGQSFAVLAVGFATLSVPLALSTRWTATTWAIEGAALVWLGLRQNRLLPRIAGILLQIAAAMAYCAGIATHGWQFETAELFILNGHFLSLTLLALAGFTTSWLYDRSAGQRLIVWFAFGWGWFWWTMAGLREITINTDVLDAGTSWLLFISFTAALAALLRRALSWPPLGTIVIASALAGVPMAIALTAQFHHPFGDYAHWAWLAWLVAMIEGLRRLRDPLERGISWAHVSVLVTTAFVAGIEAAWRVQQAGDLGSAWALLALVAPTAILLWGTRRLSHVFTWPLADEYPRYALRWEAPATAALLLAWIGSQFDPGNTAPLPYIPVINPLELAQIAGLIFAARYTMRETETSGWLRVVLPFAVLVQLTMMTLRGVHQIFDAPWSPEILDSRVAQTALTVVWAIVGVSAWIYGSKRLQRGVWRAGAIIIALVLVKLMLVDRQYIGNLPGIVSFLAVGVLMIAVGYFAPSPPKRVEAS